MSLKSLTEKGAVRGITIGASAEAVAYQDKTVLVTGGGGFIGLNIIAQLLETGARVRVLDRGRRRNEPTVSALLRKVDFIEGSIGDEQLSQSAVAGCDVIFNLAGRSGATTSNADPVRDTGTNVCDQLCFLEACRKTRFAGKLVFASTRLVYKPGQILPVSETAEVGPTSAYGINKLSGEFYHRLYAGFHGMRATSLRLTNPYGPFQSDRQTGHGIVNLFIQMAVRDETLTVYGDGRQLRDYVHIDDIVRVFMKVGLDSATDGGTFNVGGGVPISLIDMAHLIVKLTKGGRVESVPWPHSAAFAETGDFVADNSLIERTIGWKPQVILEEGLLGVIAHYRKTARAQFQQALG